ncbi:MAG: hypothetical protein JSS87_10465 [Acidobacteria bacterium]|nr:hypothetical protein [Acidobacteriota bacterium]
MRWTWAAIFYVGFVTHAMAQQSSRAEVRLEAHDGQTQFKLGDLIQLDLVFQDAAFPDIRAEQPGNRPWLPLPGQPTVNNINYPDIADDATITPATGWFRWRAKSAHDYSTRTPVDATGIRIPVLLNQGYVFRQPGHYEITITTRRMAGTPITTNAVGIDITARSPEDEAALVWSLNAAIASTRGKEQQKAAQQLAFLPGEDAARAKVQWLLGPHQWVASIMTDGLAATEDQALQLQLLKSAWADPSHAPDGTLQWALKRAEAFARGQMEPGWTMIRTRKEDATTRALEAEYAADLDRVIATLPQRTGDVRRDTAYYLMQDNQLTPGQMARVKPVVLEEFSRMSPIARSMLIETRWNAIRDPSLAPELIAMIKSKARNMDAAAAVQRLVEIDWPEARPYVVEMICRPGRGLLLNKLNGIKEDRLPEVDACLTSMLARGEQREHDFEWEQAALRAARFATPAVLPSIKAAWTNPSQDASMLAVLMRDAPEEAVVLLQREPDIQWYPANQVYEALGGKLPPQVLVWLRSPKAPKYAAYELSQFGGPEDRILLESHLAALRAQWRGREAEMQHVQPNTPAYMAKSEEQELVSSLLGAKAWTLTPEEKQRITDGCVSDWCRRYAPRQTSQSQ